LNIVGLHNKLILQIQNKKKERKKKEGRGEGITKVAVEREEKKPVELDCKFKGRVKRLSLFRTGKPAVFF
jgi:hypothetical protein